jgi:hypothetical protein
MLDDPGVHGAYVLRGCVTLRVSMFAFPGIGGDTRLRQAVAFNHDAGYHAADNKTGKEQRFVDSHGVIIPGRGESLP